MAYLQNKISSNNLYYETINLFVVLQTQFLFHQRKTNQTSVIQKEYLSTGLNEYVSKMKAAGFSYLETQGRYSYSAKAISQASKIVR